MCVVLPLGSVLFQGRVLCLVISEAGGSASYRTVLWRDYDEKAYKYCLKYVVLSAPVVSRWLASSLGSGTFDEQM